MVNVWWFSRAILAGTLLFLIAIASTAAGGFDRPFTALFVFGDSLSDSGNAFVLLGGSTADEPYDPIPSAPYDTRRFTNGRTWVEFLADELRLPRGGLPALKSPFFGNYAVGGARAEGGSSPDFHAQVQLFLKNHRGHAPSGALYVVAFGGNDIRAALQAAELQAGDPYQEIESAIQAVVDNIDELYGAGARKFLIANAGDLGRAPVVADREPEVVGFATELSNAYNQDLDTALLNAVVAWPGIDIYRLNLFGFISAAAEMPDGFGFTNNDMAPDPCLPVIEDHHPAGEVCDDPDQRLFWDGVHPTRAAYRIVGNIAFNVLPANRDERP